MGMSSVWGIAKDYVRSLLSANDGRHKLNTLVGQLGVPLGCGIAAGVARVNVAATDSIITGVSIVAALMCGVATLLFQTRVDLRQRYDSRDNHFFCERDLELVDELFSQVLWSILSGFLLVFILMLKSSFGGELAGFEAIVRLGYGVAWCLIANFVLTVALILKRIRAVYIIIAKEKRNEL